ncbi:reticulocyte-binding protein homolog 2a-like [Cydia pomonella]|uniref:reticulocyte-binding protein homolog 2a-like n=1 Tax=Cydia pomonella TaxID=82600 RepID=UPI002ADDF741|nr:reticulocyte-binding protein homolog 2a-like [Cydia pomonella]
MYGMVVWTCLVVLHQFHGILCDETKEVNWEFKTNVTKSGPESDNQNTKHNNGKTLSSQTIEPKENIVPESTDKIKVPTNERNEPRDVNNILIDIATIAHNKNNTKGIEKIRQLVDEIAKQNEIKHNVEANGIKPLKDEPSVTNANTLLRYIEPINDIETKETMNIVSLKKPTKHSENDQLVTKNTKIVLKHIEPTNYIETKETVDIVSLKKPTNHTKGEQLITENAKTVLPINDIETNETVDIVSPKKHEQLLTKNTKVVVKYVEPRNKTTKKESVFHIFVNKPITGDHEDTRTTEIKAPKPLFINTRRQAGDISDHDGDRAITTSKGNLYLTVF